MLRSECSRHGVCTISPDVASFREISKIILRATAYYLKKLDALGLDYKNYKLDIISAFADMISVADYSEKQMLDTVIMYYTNLIKVKREYIYVCKAHKIKPVNRKFLLTITPEMNLSDLLNQGQKIIVSATKQGNMLSKCYSELAEILLINAAQSIIKLSDYEDIDNKQINLLMRVLSSANNKTNLDKLIKLNKDLLQRRYNSQRKRFGKISKKSVNKSSVKGKAILATGSNLLDLYNLLSVITDINIYTHGNLLLAHAYEGFEKFKNLKGHFSAGENNFDFSNFPGAIYLTKHSAFNLSNVFRGKIFSPDGLKSKNVVNIFSFAELKEYTDKVFGFKNSHELNPVEVGYNKTEFCKKLEEVKGKIVVVACDLTPDKYVLNFYPDFIFGSLLNTEQNNGYYSVNTAGNMPLKFYLINKILKNISAKKIEFYFAYCDYNTITLMLILQKAGVKNIFLSECSSTIFNPTMLKIFMNNFGIKELKKSS